MFPISTLFDQWHQWLLCLHCFEDGLSFLLGISLDNVTDKFLDDFSYYFWLSLRKARFYG